jgi:lipoprotein-anchoring transpeptidase ErfK/SrfK
MRAVSSLIIGFILALGSELSIAMPPQESPCFHRPRSERAGARPRRLEQMAKLHGLSYKSPLEELSEKFHISESLLQTLNPGANFDRAGTIITVPDVEPMALHRAQHTIEVGRPKAEQNADTIVVDKPARQVRAYGKEGKLLGFYPATIGSDEKPAPSGTFKVQRVAWNPDYHYDPKFGWKNVKTKQANNRARSK